ncbi:MAG: tyrosine-type recombinase/integrase [Candidatus Gastranaerophilaceae bacterium]
MSYIIMIISRALNIYLNDAYHIFNKKNSEYLILNHNGGKLSDRYVKITIYKLVKKANLDIKISPHTIRHTFATDMLEEGGNIGLTVKELLGHESLNTTSIYTYITNEQIKKTYNMAHPRAKKEGVNYGKITIQIWTNEMW